jgi:foldase protein PrsA
MRLALPAVLLAAAALAAGCGSSKPKAVAAPKDSVAQVGSQTITQARLDSVLASARAYYVAQKKTFPKVGSAAYKTVRSEGIEFLVQSAVFEQQAATMGIKVTDKQVDTAIANVKKTTFGGNEKKFEAGLKQQGMTLDELKEQELLSLAESAIRTKVLAGVKVSDAEAKAYYDKHPSSYKVPASRSVRHILVAKKALADSIYTKLKGGASFASLVTKYSTDTGSKTTGGKLTDTKGSFVAAFEKVAFALKTNEISKPVHSQYGWHIIQALAPIKPASTQPFAKAKSAIKQQLLQTDQQTALTAFTTKTYKTFCAGQIAYGTGFAPVSKATNVCAAATAASTTTSATTTG